MAINLHKKYEKVLADYYTHNSYVDGHTNNQWSFSGFKSILIPTVVTQPLVDYTRSGTNRYGTPQDIQDTVQEMTMTQDKAFSLVVDKGDNSEQQMMKNAANMIKREVSEQVVPLIDKYALKRWTENAGCAAAIATAPTKSTIVGMLLDAEVYLDDHFVPDGDRWCYLPHKYLKMVKLSDEFSGCDGIVNNMVVKGYVGNLGSLKIIKISENYLPSNCYFLVAQKNSVILAQKIRDTKIHQDPPGISGHLMEGRYNYDAFVVGAHCDGVYAAVASSAKAATPTATKGGSTTTLASTTGSATIRYTLDGTDPRYSTTAQIYSAAFNNPDAGTVLKAVASADGYFASDVLVHTCA